jgi:hypothetical protein
MTGFNSKRNMAQDKLDDDDAQGYIAQYESALKKEYQRGYEAGKAAQPEQEPEPDVVMHCDSHTWTINNPPPKGSGDVNLYYAARQTQGEEHMNDRQLMQQAFERIKQFMSKQHCFFLFADDIVTIDKALAQHIDKLALAQPEQEPVAWRYRTGTFFNREIHWRYMDSLEGTEKLLGIQPLYTHPPQRTWVGSGDLEDSNAYQTPPAQPAQQERNFCSRCGKRTADLTVIHTCTPPQENT